MQRVSMSLKKTKRIMILDFPQAADGIKPTIFRRKKCTKAETNGYTSGMLMCQNAKADRHNFRRSGKYRQRNMQQYRPGNSREDGYIPLHGLVCLVFCLS